MNYYRTFFLTFTVKRRNQSYIIINVQGAKNFNPDNELAYYLIIMVGVHNIIVATLVELIQLTDTILHKFTLQFLYMDNESQ